MGCLTTNFTNLNTQVAMALASANDIHLNAQNVNDANVHVVNKNSVFDQRFTNMNTKPHLTIALVCQVSLGQYEYFYVQDEPLMVTNGYFLVKRQNRL